MAIDSLKGREIISSKNETGYVAEHTLENEKNIVVVAGSAIREHFNDEEIRGLGQLVHEATEKLPNLLTQNAESQYEQIKKGDSIVMFEKTENGLVPIRYFTIYPYEKSPKYENGSSMFGEAGTACSLVDSYSGSDTGNVYPHAGRILYDSLEQLATLRKMAILGTTTGVAALVASMNAGWHLIDRDLLAEISGRNDLIPEVCVCGQHKTLSDGGDTENATCKRAPERILLPEDLEFHPTNSGPLAPCMWRIFVPRNHRYYDQIIDRLQKYHQHQNDRIQELIAARNNEQYNFI